MKDCLDRKSFDTNQDARRFIKWFGEKIGVWSVPWKCDRCDLWHISSGSLQALRAQQTLKRERCVSDRDLHLQMCRVLGTHLEYLDWHYGLEDVHLKGPGVEFLDVRVP